MVHGLVEWCAEMPNEFGVFHNRRQPCTLSISTINSGAFKMGANVAETSLESFLRIQCEPHRHLTENSRRKIEWNSFPQIQENYFPFGRKFTAIQIVVFGRMKSVPCTRSMPQFSKKYYRGNYRNFNVLIFWKFQKFNFPSFQKFELERPLGNRTFTMQTSSYLLKFLQLMLCCVVKTNRLDVFFFYDRK